MAYPKLPNFTELCKGIELSSQLKHEYGAKGITPEIKKAAQALKAAITAIQKLPIDKTLATLEPNNAKAIRKLRPDGPRKMWKTLNSSDYADRLEGAFLARCAGCTLGAPVEFWSIDDMIELAENTGHSWPPVEYWKTVTHPWRKRYQMSRRDEYTKNGMDGVPVDDDIAYTLLGLLVAEDHGVRFSIDDNGKAWLKYLPYACTAEKVALENLKIGVPAKKAGEKNNPFCEWIGADIRADPWGYMAPAYPEFAADMAYRDAYLSHRRNGIYGEMYFAAAISAAFGVDDPIDALKIGLTEIPADCAMANAVRWALSESKNIPNWRAARDAMDSKFKGMHNVHTINNACLTIWGITIGGTDVTKVLSETVAMGMDNDCTAATAGSIVGAVVGKSGVPAHWYKNFNNRVKSYLIKRPEFKIDDLLRRFEKQAKATYKLAGDGKIKFD